MSLKQRIQDDLIQAMKNKEQLKTSALKMLKAEIMKEEVSGTKSEATDDQVMQITKRLIKQRKDAAEQFRAGNRAEMAENEEKEAEFLSVYLPEQMSEEKVKEIVQQTIDETGASSAADMGKVMGAVMGKLQGQADGTMVNKIVRELLA